MTVEIAAGFYALSVIKVAHGFRLTMQKPVGLGLLAGLPPLRPLARGSKVDNLGHTTPRK